MFTLDEIARHHGTDKSTAFHGYTPTYTELFEGRRLNPVQLLEIGVATGCSVRTWLDYFPRATVVGVDIAPQFSWTDPRYHQIIADQYREAEMAERVKPFAPFDIVIDDGCHKADACVRSFNALWPLVKSGGYYIVEDVGTFWHPMYQSTAEGWTWLHSFVDDVQQRGKDFYGAPPYGPAPSGLELQIRSVAFRKGLAILEKR